MLGFDVGCGGCMNRGKKYEKVARVDDPEADIDRRINKEILKTIGDILSEVVHNAISSSFQDTIQLDDWGLSWHYY